MLSHLLERLNRLTIVLASASPRRRELLTGLGLKFRVIPSGFAEDLDKSSFSSPAAYVMENARRKALDLLKGEARTADLIISADTVVVLDGQILEKPSSPEHARQMLRSLSGKCHDVITGVTLVHRLGRRSAEQKDEPAVESFHTVTRVEFGDLPQAAIDAYVATGEPMCAYGLLASWRP